KNLIYGTYIGSNQQDWGEDIAIDSTGAAYVVGWTSGADFPRTIGQNPTDGADRPVVVKFDAAGSLVYSSVIGTQDANSTGTSIAVDTDGSAYLGVASNHPDFPRTGGSTVAGGMVVKLNPTGGLGYSTWMGGGVVFGIAVDDQHRAWVTGSIS